MVRGRAVGEELGEAEAPDSEGPRLPKGQQILLQVQGEALAGYCAKRQRPLSYIL